MIALPKFINSYLYFFLFINLKSFKIFLFFEKNITICIYYLILIAFPASSKWKKIFENKTFTEFFEIDAVKKIDDIIYIWSMRDFKSSKKWKLKY